MSKKHKLLFTREFLRRLKRLDREVHIRVLRRVKILEEKPFSGKRLGGRLNGLLSLRVGDYRIIYQITKDQVIIRTIGHRKSIYKR